MRESSWLRMSHSFPEGGNGDVTSDDRRNWDPTKVPQELPLPAPCVSLLILPIRQTIGPGSTQRRSTTAVPRATQTVGLE